ncbi:serine/threonine-protein kinase [Paraliomyxa miuraensis]|uniref:serine/threonine-protein kinase n=1 Tax=Paraliomyxa miuraensis TaxID=376150 RepID=UPI0022522588|nr:serine/threonine-protein kinase [Paraliomyxa miuraensis]
MAPLDGVGDERRERPRALVIGELIGRYVVLSKLGAGGMGVVYAAYDPELDRKVALKLLLPGVGGEKGKSRLLREAQALGKLAHPNVVGIYDVGTLGEQVWLAMEFVRGQTLGAWLEMPRSWREVVEVLVGAGEGLCAAHAAGLLHRDFKPDNVMVGDDGRVRVMDFGLARTRVGGESTEDERSRPQPNVEALALALTQQGSLVGTPSYMAPEQFSNASMTAAAADQFSFCVTLWQALYGERPFEGDSLMVLIANVVSGRRRAAPKKRKVPSRLLRACERGLAVEPQQRWPSMEALVAELRRLVVPRGRRRAVALLTVGLVTVGAGLTTTRTLDWLERCTGARKQLEGAWDETRREEVEAAILGTRLSYAPGTWERVEARLDEYADAWTNEHTNACEATRSRNEQTEEEMSLRMGCLHERWQHLRATVNELRQADAPVVENAVRAVTSLPGMERCRDLKALRAEVPPPEDPAVALQVEALEVRLVEAKAKQEAGKYEEGLWQADEVVEKGAALEHEPLMVRAWLRQGILRAKKGEYEGAVEVLRRAYGSAVVHIMTAEAADAAGSLVYVLGVNLAQHEEAEGWVEHAEALAQAVGTDVALAIHLSRMGSVAKLQGQYDRARDFHERALAIREKALPPDDLQVAVSLGSLGSLSRRQGHYEDARDLQERALAIKEEVLGPDHPQVATSLNNLGNVMEMLNEYDRARDLHERARAIYESALGPDHPEVATSLDNLGDVARSQGQLERARDLYERALAIREKTLGPDHPKVASVCTELGIVAQEQGEHERARDSYERAEAIYEKTLGPDHPYVAYPLTGLGTLRLDLAEPADALAPLERALAIRTTHEVDRALLAETQFALARALWSSPAAQGPDRPRARGLAEQARDAYATLGEAKKTELDEVQAWLAEHPLP